MTNTGCFGKLYKPNDTMSSEQNNYFIDQYFLTRSIIYEFVFKVIFLKVMIFKE